MSGLRRPLTLLLASVSLAAIASTARAATGAPARVRPTQALVALFQPHQARSHPRVGSARLGLVPATTPLTGERTALPLLGRHGQWLKVRLPGRPNGHTGWITRAATGLSITRWHIVVDLSSRRVTVYLAGRITRVFRAVVGKPSTPTPTGEFFVEETIRLRATDVGAPYALALSARSNVLQEFAGGPGQIALHGLANVGGVLGSAASHGCIRLGNQAVTWLATRIPPGTPVTVARSSR